MSLIALLALLVIIGVILYFVNKAPMVGWMKMTINIVCIIVVILLLLQAFGILDDVKSVNVPKLSAL